NYIHGNSRWHELFNPGNVDIKGRTVVDFFPTTYSQEVRDQEKRTLERKEMTEYEYLSPVVGGGTIPTLGQMFPITDDRGAVTALGCTLTDISSNKKTERALREALLKAEEANQSKSKFLATMSHELRTPLNAIIGFSDIMTGEYFGPVGNQKYIEYAKDINHSGRHLLALIDEVLDISAIELGKRKMVMEPVSLPDLLSSCVKAVRQRAESRGIMIAQIVDASLPVISADETAIRQIFLNLLTNAIKFSHSGDKVTLSARADKDKVVIAVVDTGDGIKKDQLPNITNPFVKGHSDSHITHEGVGLGLSIVQCFVVAHQGTLNIESEVGQGTRVTVCLPRDCKRKVA
ncbi:MAG: ATP-binding protein, partial [Sneathiella sp.]